MDLKGDRSAAEVAQTRVFDAICSERRRRILHRLTLHGEQDVTQLVDTLDINQPVLSLDLERLRAAGLVERSACGRRTLNRVVQAGLAPAFVWISELLGKYDAVDVPLSSSELDLIFRRLSLTWVRRLLNHVGCEDKWSAADLQRHLGVGQPEASRRLALVVGAGLLEVQPVGVRRIHTLSVERVWTAWGWIATLMHMLPAPLTAARS